MPKARVAHVNFPLADLDEVESQDLEQLFALAVERRYAWVTGVAPEGSYEDLSEAALDAGYVLWVPDEEYSHGDYWLAVREDLVRLPSVSNDVKALPDSQNLVQETTFGVDQTP